MPWARARSSSVAATPTSCSLEEPRPVCTPVILAGFTAMRGLVAEEEDPTLASRPFDATRAGFVMGEGACVLLLEDRERARRARRPHLRGDARRTGRRTTRTTWLNPIRSPVGVAEMMQRGARASRYRARRRSGYINAHGTSTPQGDLAETKALKEVFGEHAYELAVSSTKSVLGHMFGAAGAVEAIMCVLALHEGVPAADDQLPDAGSRVRPRLRPERGQAGAGGGGPLERDGARRAQRVRARRRGRAGLTQDRLSLAAPRR